MCLCVVDTSEAGVGDVEVNVMSGNTKVTVRRDQLSEFCQRFMFVPTLPSNHVISVAFNGENVIGLYCVNIFLSLTLK